METNTNKTYRHGVRPERKPTAFEGEALKNHIRKSLAIIEKYDYPIAVTETNCPPEVLKAKVKQFKEQGVKYKIEHGQVFRKVTDEELEEINRGDWIIKGRTFQRNF